MIGGPAVRRLAPAHRQTRRPSRRHRRRARARPGASASSVTVTVIGWSAVFSRAPVPLVARTTTSYVVVPVGVRRRLVVRRRHERQLPGPGDDREPVEASAPPSIVYPVTLSSVSASDAATVPAAVWFSAASNVAERAEHRRRVRVRRAAARTRPVAAALVVPGQHLHVVLRVFRKLVDRRAKLRDRRSRHLHPRPLRRPHLVAVVVVRDRRPAVRRLAPAHRQTRRPSRRHRRRARARPGASASSVTVTVIGWSAVFSRAPVPLVARTTTSYALCPGRPSAPRSSAPPRTSAPRSRRRSRTCRGVRAALDRVPRHAVLGVGVRRRHRTRRGLVLRRIERRQRGEHRPRVRVRRCRCPTPTSRCRPRRSWPAPAPRTSVFSSRSVDRRCSSPDTFVSPAVKAPLSPTRYCRS